MNPNEPDTPELNTPPGDAADVPAAKPKRRRTPKATLPTEAGSSPVAEDAPAAMVPPVAAAAAGAQAASAVPTAPDLPAAPTSAEGDAPAVDAAGGDAPAGDAGDGAAGPDGRRRRNRNRRRGRRGADRAGRGDGEGAGDAPAGGEIAAGADGGDVFVAPPSLPPADVGDVFAGVVSGAFDAETGASAAADEASQSTGVNESTGPVAGDGSGEKSEPATPAAGVPAAAVRRVLAPETDAPKLHKVLAQAGVGSRRDLEQMIADGRVTVNAQPAHTGQRISFGDRIQIDGKPVRVRINPPLPRVLAYHKPAGEVVSHDDPQHRPTVFRRLPRLQHGKWQSVGRLDINTEGLLLFTNSGDLANRLMHPRFGVEREYAVRVLGLLSAEHRTKLLEGVEIEGQPAAFRSIEDGGGEGANHWYRVVITEGRNREVRKLFDAVGHAVSRLIRIRYGSVVLPRGLKRGVWVDLGGDDVKALRQSTGMQRHAAAEAGPGPDDARGRRGGRRGRGGRRDEGARRDEGGRREEGPRPVSGNEREPRAEHDDSFDDEHRGPIPNPLQQTFDKRAIQQARRLRDIPEDGPIPNPLQQTYDKRALQGDRGPVRDTEDDGPIPNPLQQTYDKRFNQGPKRGAGGGGGGGGGVGGGAGGRARKKGGSGQRGGGGGSGERQPDPMRTAVGYIGANAFHQKSRGGGRGGRGGGSGGGGAGGRGR